MIPVLIGGLLQYILGITLFVMALFLILLVLVQRGRGGGLTGALGGVGGQSAFGAKAGDLFTRITVVAACVWILTCMFTIIMLNGQGDFRSDRLANPRSTTTTDGKENQPGANGTTPGPSTNSTETDSTETNSTETNSTETNSAGSTTSGSSTTGNSTTGADNGDSGSSTAPTTPSTPPPATESTPPAEGTP